MILHTSAEFLCRGCCYAITFILGTGRKGGFKILLCSSLVFFFYAFFFIPPMMSSKQKGVLQCLYGCEFFFPMRIHLCLLAYIALVPPSHGQDGKGRCGKCFYKATVETPISPFNLFSAHGTLNSALFLKSPPKMNSEPGFVCSTRGFIMAP